MEVGGKNKEEVRSKESVCIRIGKIKIMSIPGENLISERMG
jgi:hypothetical protein